MNELDELLGCFGGALDDGLDAAAAPAADQARALLIGAIHVESPSTGGRRRRRRRGFPDPVGHGRWSGLLAIGLSVAVALVVLVVALGIGGHRPSSSGGVPTVLPFGSSLNPSGPTGVVASSVRLAAVVPDPVGSGPAWGIKTYRLKDDQTCFQVGREQSGRIGAVGGYGSFNDDGRFHPFTFSDVGFGTCVPSDAHQHAFDNVAYANAPASASGEPCQTFAHGFPLHLPAQVRAHLTAQSHAADCQPDNQRLVAFGLLGPDATSVTYRTAHGTATTPTHGPDGAYLIVEPVDPAICGTQCGYAGGGSSTAMSLPVGLIATITYRDAPTCHGPPLTNNGPTLPRVDHCRDVGYVAPPHPKVTQADVASPITVRALPGDGPFCGNDQGGLWYVCKPGEIPLEGTSPTIVLRVSFTARVAVRNAFSGYFVHVQNPGNCGGSGGTVNQNVSEDARITVQQDLQTRCKGTFHGAVEYIPNIGPAGRGRAVAGLAEQGALTVGTFTYQLRNLRPTTSTQEGVLDGSVAPCCTATGSTPEPGTIVVYGANGTQRYVYPGASGHFSVSLPPGHYRVVGGIPKLGWRVGRCLPVPADVKSNSPSPTVAVNSNHTTTISVVCKGHS
ncbi:MAG TPA: hypothetical protein VIK04_19180 [Solirubrobacteraceae bacterium]